MSKSLFDYFKNRMKSLSYFSTALYLSIVLVQQATTLEISQNILHDVIEDVLNIFYGLPVFKSPSCAELEPKKLYYYLYNPENRNPIRLNAEGTGNDFKHFNPSLETKLVTHGWLGEINGSWAEDFKNAYLETGNYNVILLDWSEYSSSRYSTAACYVPKVANVTAKLIIRLAKDAALELNKVHLIGHSLGGQMVGITGQFIQNFTNGEKVKRATGLDAAGPLFCKPNLEDADKRITADDAQFVDGIHTNDGEFGCENEYAQSNFYPNCGKSQRGCTKVNISLGNITGSFKEFFSKISCSHARSHQYWLESIVENDFPSHTCTSCSSFSLNRCSKNLENNMGEYVSSSEDGIFFLKTNRQAPYGSNGKERSLLPFT